MQPENRPDRRVVKTRKAIRNALAYLVTQKDITNITVKDIAQEADINRKTFYNHYAGVYQVIEQVEDEIISSFKKTLHEISFTQMMKNPKKLFEKLTEAIEEDISFYGNIVQASSRPRLYTKLIDQLQADYRDSMTSQGLINGFEADLVVNYVVSGVIGVFQHWFNSGRREPLGEISSALSTLTFSGINGLISAQQA